MTSRHSELLRHLVCAGLCRYYKPTKWEDPGCGGIEALKRRPDLAAALPSLPPEDQQPYLFSLADDDPRLLAVCASCAFRADGCDFRDPNVPREDCAPCGGLRAVAGLYSQDPELKL